MKNVVDVSSDESASPHPDDKQAGASDVLDEIVDEHDNNSDFYENHPCAINEPWYIRNPKIENVDDDKKGFELLDHEYEPVCKDPSIDDPFTPPSMRDDAPLAGILQNSELDKVDPRYFFPDFSRKKILRFSRLFGANIKSSSRTKIWWTSRTFQANELDSASSQQSLQNDCPKLLYGDIPTTDECINDETLLVQSSTSAASSKEGSGNENGSSSTPWRYGPASCWYDRMNVPPNPKNFDYGFKLKKQQSANRKNIPRDHDHAPSEEAQQDHCLDMSSCPEFPPETFLPVNLIKWENDIIFDEEQARQQILKRISSDKLEYGWIPTQQTRTYETFMAALKCGALEQMFSKSGSSASARIGDLTAGATNFAKEPSSSHSLFPLDNYELLNTRWEDDIIWDAENMDHIPEPKLLTLDYHDDPKLFGMPEDKAVEEKAQDFDSSNQPKPFDRKEHQFTKKSKMILGQVQQRQKQEEDEQMESSVAQMTDKDPFNLSNDDYYMPKNTERSVGGILSGSMLQHSIPAQNIHCTFFPTHMNTTKLRHYHRLTLTKRVLRTAGNRFTHIQTLEDYIKERELQREKQKAAEGGGEIFFMRDIEDLSGKDGILLLMEYSEEHPPLLNQPGMASKIRNYYKRKVGKETDPVYEFGETAFTHTLPFLGSLAPGQGLQSLENNLFRAPIYKHSPFPHDFLLIRTKKGFFIRRCPALFLVGQECPLTEVPSPNSKRATVFVRDFLLAYIYRLFWASDQNPRRLKMEDIKSAFPHYAESSVRKRLKQCSDFKRLGQGPDQNFWVLRSDFRLPSKEEVLAMVTPEMCCAQYSMLAAEQRLKDAGYGEKYFFTPENEDDSDDQVTIEDEIKCAPWNTTRAYIAAVRGKCLLDQTGIADPTGCGEGFSYVRVSAKPQKAKEEVPSVPKRLVTGTNADLRKLPLKEAKEICRDYGVHDEEINALSRWEIIDVIRTLSTQAAKARSDFSGMARFARGNIRFNFADMQEKYKKFCQRTFDLQNQNLSNSDILSTDEGNSADDSDDEELATKLESILDANKGKKGLIVDKKKLEFEQEEKERKALQKMMQGDLSESKNEKDFKVKENVAGAVDTNVSLNPQHKKLKIYRTYKAEDGTETTRIEVISRPQLIEAYLRIRTTRDDTFIQVYAQMDEQYKEERRKEKRRLQDQLRRIRRNELKARLQGVPIGQAASKVKPVEKKPPVIKPNLLKMKCSACHGTGHMKTNKNCPLYGKNASRGSVKTIGDIHPVAMTDEQLEKMAFPTGELIAVEGTKLKISRKLYSHAEMIKKNSLRLHIPRGLLEGDRRRSGEDDNLLKGIDTGEVTDQCESSLDKSVTTQAEQSQTSKQNRAVIDKRLPAAGSNKRRLTAEMDDYLFGPQKTIKRIRADPRVSMSTVLSEIFHDMRNVTGSEEITYPVNPKKVPDYYDLIKEPMDLHQIKKKITGNQYELRRQFLYDIKLILDNSRLYNGDAHPITATSKRVFEIASMRVAEREQKLIALEKSINPLLDDNDIIGFSFILDDIVQHCKNIPKSGIFHIKVDPKKLPQYYEKIDKPMDLGTIQQNIKEHKYRTVEHFRNDIRQIQINSELYNGPPEVSVFTSKAKEICCVAENMLEQHKDQLVELEANMLATLNDHVDAASNSASTYIEEGETSYPSTPAVIPGSIKEELDDEDMVVMDSLQDDLALSGDEDGDDEMDEDEHDSASNWYADGEGESLDAENELLRSRMHNSGQLNADLALSDSDQDDDEQFFEAKRPKLEDLNTM